MFGRVRALKVPVERTSKFVMPFGLGVLEMRFAGPSNPGYRNATWHLVRKPDPTELEVFEQDVKLFVDHVVIGWDGVTEGDTEDDQQLVAFSPEKLEAFLRELFECSQATWYAIKFHAQNRANYSDAKPTSDKPAEAKPLGEA